jgi:coenzyme F420-0:L-glutamate ligase/coenzyme F420-1:gamma-L-glutamate ligase
VNLAEAVAARRSIRAFEDRPVPRDAVLRAIGLAVQAPAPHHSSPWRFSLVEDPSAKDALSRAMGAAWRDDLTADGHPHAKVEAVLARSHALLTGAPLLTVCSADMSKAHAYPDERRRLAEWSLFAHATGAALQVYMVALAEDGVASCWISAPVFCRDVVRRHLGLPDRVEPQALVLAGYASPGYSPRPRGPVDPRDYVVGS